ncbi:MAG: TPM domain-containing protein [Burkholderiales bacterium]
MSIQRYFTHLTKTRFALRRAFSPPTLANIESAIARDETRHGGQIRFVVETALDWPELRARVSARERALEVFSHLRIWDTEENNGVLVYVLLAERDVEIVADRGIHAKAGADAWESICRGMEQAFRAGHFEQGSVAGIHAVGEHLAKHFPPSQGRRDELPNKPVVL